MSLLESIRAGHTLRKVEITHDASMPSLIDSIAISSKYDSLVLQANIENWGNALAEFTAPTKLVSLTQAHAALLRQAYESLSGAEAEESVRAAASAYVSSQNGTTSAPLCAEEAQLLRELSGAVQSAIDGLAHGKKGCFVKLSSRSPKDAAARSGVLEAHYTAALDKSAANADSFKSTITGKLDDMQRLWIICKAEGAALRFGDAAGVIRALVLSERVWQDLTLALRHPDKWEQNIIVRRWEPVPVDMEFRTFVSNGQMTAVLQYAYQLCSPRLTDTAQLHHATAAIAALFAQMWPVLEERGFTSCVLDFGVISNEAATSGGAKWRTTLIELNPFEETTDGALFSWTRKRDVIEGKAVGVEYPVVRVTKTKRVAALSMLPRSWKDVIEKVEQEREL